jgi:hypothetical protein
MGGDSDLEALTQLFANGHFSGEIAVLFCLSIQIHGTTDAGGAWTKGGITKPAGLRAR